MDYEDFKEQIIGILGESLPECEFETRNVAKNNGVSRDGIVISSNGSQTSPVIYLEEIYQDVKDGTVSLEEAAEKIMGLIRDRMTDIPFTLADFEDFSKLKGRVVFRLVNGERNAGLLKRVPHINRLDLAVVFAVMLESDGESCSSFLIDNTHASLWKIDADGLMALAMENTPRLLGWKVSTMQELLGELMCDGTPGGEIGTDDAFHMYVLTNRLRIHGASCILYPGMREKLAEKLGGGFYVIPSSIHELILIPDNGNLDPESLRQMINEVNRTQVPVEEILSDHPYHCAGESKELLAA